MNVCNECQHENTVVVTVATSRTYLQNAQQLAVSATSVGIRCTLVIVAAAMSGSATWPLIEFPMPIKVASWLPPPEWCRPQRVDRSGYRQTSVLKTSAIVEILRLGRDAFFVDADYRFLSNPIPTLRATGVDVAAMRDTLLLNVGLLWLRASETRLLMVAKRIANRSYAAWDQAVLNEEVAAAASVSCCYTNQFIKKCINISEGVHRFRRTGDADVRQSEQPGCAKATAPLHVLGPPIGGSRLFRVWSSSSYNMLPMEWRRMSRCTARPCPSSLARAQTSDEAAPPSFRCTAWPTRAPASWDDSRRCEDGNRVDVGHEYVFNRGRGTAAATCSGPCACCKRPRPSLPLGVNFNGSSTG